MKLQYGTYTDVNGYLGPVRMIGFFKDILYDATHIYALVMWKWYVGVVK